MAGFLYNTSLRSQLRILFCICLFEYVAFIFSGVSYSFLYKDPFFTMEADTTSWLIYVIGIPQFIIAHHWLGLFLDTITVFFFIFLILNPFNNKLAFSLLVLLLLFYITLMGYLTHRNYQSGFFLVFIPFIFRKDLNKYFAYEVTRYFLLVFYVSAAFLKLMNGTLADQSHFSHMLTAQFTAYYLENNTGLRTNLNLYLIHHNSIAYVLYIASFLTELFPFAGFFTKRFDKWIAVLLIVFHFITWILMDIAPLGQIAFISLLFLNKSVKKISGTYQVY